MALPAAGQKPSLEGRSRRVHQPLSVGQGGGDRILLRFISALL